MTVRGMTLKNRILMPPMGTNFATVSGEVSEDMKKYYELRAKGGTGLITVENTCVDFPMGTNGTKQLRIDDNQFVPGLYELAETIHAYGAKASIQLNHAGASAYPGRLDGVQTVSASKVPSKSSGNFPRELMEAEIYQIAEKYGKAAARAQLAGFDAVEIHGGHSYLICQFMSPLFNKRTDSFGGSSENRARFARLVLNSVRQAVGPRFPISFRISADDFLNGGNTLEDMLEIMEYLVDEIDIINVSAAQNDNLQYQIDMMSLDEGWRSYLGKAFKEKFGKPVVVAGNIRTPQIAEDILARGDADILAMGRGLISEPNWVNKVARGQENLLRKCVSCNIGCSDHRIGQCKPIRCTINPDLLYEDVYKEKKVIKNMNVIVVGAGSAGMEAACTMAEVGCNVTLLEEKDRVGGLAWLIGLIPSKERIHYFVNFLVNRIEALPNLDLRLNTKATRTLFDELKPDLVINATGSIPLLPPIQGLADHVDKEGSKVKSTFGFIDNVDSFENSKGKKVVVVGGGAVGLDVVEFFAERGAEVSVVEMQPQVGRDIDLITKLAMFDAIKKHDVKVLTETALKCVNEDSFLVQNPDGSIEELKFDFGFVCLGMRSEVSDFSAMEKYTQEKNIELLNIGDSNRVRRIIDGIKEGRNVIKTLEVMGALKY
ncbi:MAG: FAD-dependent oxidoreductase [Eubacteriaceae bacterium]|nr:FAD-dependent oxidoreductase [Eubacteriaceae bacterium]